VRKNIRKEKDNYTQRERSIKIEKNNDGRDGRKDVKK
jgi:hypothetical protein